MDATTTDTQFEDQVRSCTDPLELLRLLVDLDESVDGVGDPYYRDLYGLVIYRAGVIVRQSDAS